MYTVDSDITHTGYNPYSVITHTPGLSQAVWVISESTVVVDEIRVGLYGTFQIIQTWCE
jgi:hypothetical protein